jgi:hypothetical protein
VVLLCNREGVAIHHRGDEAKAGEFNGIGTCIAEQVPGLVHADQHFRSWHTQLSCAGAPVLDGDLVAVLDVSRVASGVPLLAAFEFDRLLYRQTGDSDIPAVFPRPFVYKSLLRAGTGGQIRARMS